MVLAQYTIRSKQKYIFRTNRIKDIVGASDIITHAWDILFEEAEKAGIKLKRAGEDKTFSFEKTKESFEKNESEGVELFRGGGNETFLLKDRESFIKLNQYFSYRIITDFPGLVPMAVCADITGDYKNDYSSLMKETEKKKKVMFPGRNEFLVPFAMVDRNTFQPCTDIETIGGKTERISSETSSKRKAGRAIIDTDPAVKYLDDMVTKRGEESLLAIVHADGNNMGSKIQQMLGNKNDYDSCVQIMREFTKETADVFTTIGIEAVNNKRDELTALNPGKEKSSFLFRKLVADGDDVTFICNARYALAYTKAYLEAVRAYKNSEWSYSSCAGICYFHSHYPFARAYEMAEQCCDNAKVQIHGSGESIKEESWIDYHYIHSGIGGNLEEIRDRQGTVRSMARPWRVSGEVNDKYSINKLSQLYKIFKEFKVARTAIKSMGTDWEQSHSEGRMDLRKICGHTQGLEEKLKRIESDEDKLMKMIYDLYEIIDIWTEEE